MKKLLFILFFSPTIIFAQSDNENSKTSKDFKQEKVNEDIETYPIYPGCDLGDNNFKAKCMSQNLVNFVNKNFNVKIAIKSGLKGVHQVTVSFSINLEGNITRINAKGPNSEVDAFQPENRNRDEESKSRGDHDSSKDSQRNRQTNPCAYDQGIPSQSNECR